MLKRLKASLLALCMLATAPAATGQQQAGFNPIEAAKNGWSMEQGRSAAWHFAQHRRLASAIAALQPQKNGVIDAYVVSIGLDSDPVFRREAGEAAKVLARRYGAVGHSIFLAAGADDQGNGTPQGSPINLATALAAVAGKMNLKEDVLILFATTHGDPNSGLAYRDGDKGYGAIAPSRLANLLDDLGFERRMILLSACYSGVFLPLLTNENSIIVTAAASNRTSFGCAPGNDWTFFGDALINHGLRKPQPFEKATEEAISLIAQWENAQKLLASRPQTFVGDKTNVWLAPLEARMPKTETPKVGKPAIESF
ncbi:MAG: peptidase C13 [Sphingomonadaceae bacterium]|nr:peptidase C13 [Sphingomonadaceae bacterium]